MSLALIASPQPHFIPGYMGFCPQYKYKIGHTYGSTTHKLLLDPTIAHAEHLILSGRNADDYQVIRPLQHVETKAKYDDQVYKHPITNYDGFVPRLTGLLGQSQNVEAAEALSTFEQKQLKVKEALNQLAKHCNVQNSLKKPCEGEDHVAVLIAESQYLVPPLDATRSAPMHEHSTQLDSPYFMDNSNPDKVLKQGFAGHVPYGYAEFGETHEPMTHAALCKFTSNYREGQRQSAARASLSH